MTRFVIFALCILAFAVADEEDHEYGKASEWRRTICEGFNRTVREDFDACFQTEPQAVVDASNDCIKPTGKENMVDFLEIACVDKSLFKQYDDCLLEYEADPIYRAQMEVGPETVACYNAVMRKYGLEPVLEEEAGDQ